MPEIDVPPLLNRYHPPAKRPQSSNTATNKDAFRSPDVLDDAWLVVDVVPETWPDVEGPGGRLGSGTITVVAALGGGTTTWLPVCPPASACRNIINIWLAFAGR